MIIIGLLLLLAAVAFGVDFVWQNDFHVANPVAFGQHLGVHSAATLFVTGAITGAVGLLGLVLLLTAVRRKGAKAVTRRKARQEERRTREERDRLRAENTQLHTELDNEHLDRGKENAHEDRDADEQRPEPVAETPEDQPPTTGPSRATR